MTLAIIVLVVTLALAGAVGAFIRARRSRPAPASPPAPTDPETARLLDLFERYQAARRAIGGQADAITFAKFAARLAPLEEERGPFEVTVTLLPASRLEAPTNRPEASA